VTGPQRLEIRSQGSGSLLLTGPASVTESPYDMGFYEETIARGAFKRSLNDPDVVDVSLLIGHAGLPLARTKSGTLRLSEDDVGLYTEADLDPNDPDVARIVHKMQRGDLSDMSFGFKVMEQTWSDDYTKRRITMVNLHRGDVSIVTHGANPATSASVRSAALLGPEKALERDVPLEERRRRVDLIGKTLRNDGLFLNRGGNEPAPDCARCGDAGEITIRCPTCGGAEPKRSTPLVRPDRALEARLLLMARGGKGPSSTPARRARPLPADWRREYEALRMGRITGFSSDPIIKIPHP
jgi:HK97 family phage prohead protease